MDFFNILRQGASFGDSSKSKHVGFKTRDVVVAEEKPSTTLDFFGSRAPDGKPKPKVKSCDGVKEKKKKRKAKVAPTPEVTTDTNVKSASSCDVDQKLVFVGLEDAKLYSLRQFIVEKKLKPPALIFVQSKDRAKELFNELIYDGIFADVIHPDRTQVECENVIRAFLAGKILVLICTDHMGHGADIKDVEMVINYDLPMKAALYIRRIQRAGRNGRRGSAVSFFTEDDFVTMQPIVSVAQESGCEVDSWMLNLKKQSRDERRRAERRVPWRKPITTVMKSSSKPARTKTDTVKGDENAVENTIRKKKKKVSKKTN